MRSERPGSLLLVSLLLVAPIPALAGQDANAPPQGTRHADLGVAVRFGSLGFGVEVNKWLTGHVGARVGINYFKVTGTKSQSDISYDASLKLHAFTALVDLFPSSRGTFHLTGGIITDPAKVVATGKPSASGTFEINGTTYTSAQVGTLRGNGSFPSVSPYFGLGWGTAARNGGPIAFLFDLGAAIGKPTITLTSSAAAGNPTLASDLKAQERKTQHDVDKYAKVYPVIAVGLTYRF
jgi:hypothetical protein